MGNETVSGNLQVDGILGVDEGAIIAGGMEVAMELIVGGNISAQNDLNVTGTATIDGDAAVSGSTTVSGHVTVSGNVTAYDVFVNGQDCAEDFETLPDSDVTPGTVMVVDDAGMLRHSSRPYDNRVAGVVSGAEPYRPGMILGRTGDDAGRNPIALMGRVRCKADATSEPISPGDLLTTSATPGHAMKAADRDRAFGAVIGKALQPLSSGRGMVTILVGLQ